MATDDLFRAFETLAEESERFLDALDANTVPEDERNVIYEADIFDAMTRFNGATQAAMKVVVAERRRREG